MARRLLGLALLGGASFAAAVPAATAAGAACNTSSTVCYANHGALFAEHMNVTLEACCELAHATDKCASFTHWGGRSEDGPAKCFLFTTVAGADKCGKDVSSGVTGRAPSPAPPHPPGPAPGPKPSPAPKPSGKNFVLFLPGAVRANALGAYGHPICKTPAFDRLAAQGTLFQQAHTVSPSATPSRVAMATARYVHTKNHRTTQHLIQSFESNLFGLLHDQGYFVAFFGKNYMLSEESLAKVDYWAPEASAANTTAMLQFLADPPEQPFVMLVSTPGASYRGTGGTAPSSPSQPGYYSYYNNGSSVYSAKELEANAPLVRAQPAGSKKPAYHQKIRSYRKLEALAAPGSDFFYRLNAAYLQSVTQDVDAVLGKILDQLEKSPTLDAQTAVIASAEAGDFAGDFGLVNTWAGGLDDVLTRVPFVARIPGGAKGHVVHEQIQLFDAMPTILELSQQTPQHTKNTHFARSLVPQLMGAKGDPDRIIYAEAGFLYPAELEPLHSGGPQMASASDPRSLEFPRRQEELEGCPANITSGSLTDPNFKGCLGSPRATMARTLTSKLVYRADGDVSEFYDLTNDPKEITNLWGTPAVAQRQKELLGEMLQWYQETSDTTDWQVHTGRGAPQMGTDGYPIRPRLPKGGRAPGDKRPNFVVYFPDTVAAESCGGEYGNPVAKTPFMDALAKEGTLFKQAHVLHTQCAPSRHAIVTGRYMHTTGHRTQSHGVEAWEPDIFEYLHEAGYYINWFGKDDALGPNAFKYIDYWEGMTENHMLDFLQHNTKEPFFMFIPTIGAHPPYRGSGDPETAPNPAGECFQTGDPGFFSFYTNCTASIYDWREIKEKAPLRPLINAGNDSFPMYRRSDGIVHYHDLDREPLVSEDEAFWYRLNSVYLDMVHRVDTELGDLLAAIDNNTAAPGLKDRTAFFVSSDHGDFSGNHHLVEKWPGAVDDLLTHVPFVARMPTPEYLPFQQGMSPAKGHIVEEQIQVFDIMPTALELAGITPNRTHFATSLVPQLMGATGDPDRVVYSDGGFLYPTEVEPMAGDCDINVGDFYGHRGLEEILNYTGFNPSAPTSKPGGCDKSHWGDPNWVGCLGSPRAVMARTLKWKLVYRPREVSEFYDLTQDPRELVNLFGKPEVAAVQQEMLEGLLRWYQETTDVTPIQEDPLGYPANHTSPDQPREEYAWERYNPYFHREYMKYAVDGTPLEGGGDGWYERR